MLDFSSTLKMKAILSSEVCVNFSLVTQHHIPEDNSFQQGTYGSIVG
jgi:hypothetical protein